MQELRFRSDHDEIAATLSALAKTATDSSLVLPAETRPDPGEWVRFLVELKDGTSVLEGIGRTASVELIGSSTRVTLDELQFDARNEVIYERVQLERESRASDRPAPAEVSTQAPPTPSTGRPPSPALGPSKPPPIPPRPPKPLASRPPPGRSGPPSVPPPPAAPSSPPSRRPPASRSTSGAGGDPGAREPTAATGRSAPPAARPQTLAGAATHAAPPPSDKPSRPSAPPARPASTSPTDGDRETREIAIDRTALPIPADLAVRAATLVPHLRDHVEGPVTTHRVLRAALRIGLSALEAPRSSDLWDHDDDDD